MSETRVECPEKLDHDTGRDLLAAVREASESNGQLVVLDMAPTKEMDSLGGAWLVKIADFVRSRSGELKFEGHHVHVA